jgi:NADH dehydrogenase
MKVENVLVVGGSGFLGRRLVAALSRDGIRATVPTRRYERAKHLITLPTVEVVEADVFAPGVLERLASAKQLVVNLVGILHGRRGRRDERGPNDYGPDFARLHVELPQAIVAACRAAGVPRLLHVSALGAAADAPSEYLRSKAIGEQAVLAAEDIAPTAFRPSVMFGPEDRFLNQFARLARLLPVLAVPCAKAQFQPVYVGDVVSALVACVNDRDTHGKVYELAGPRVYALEDLVRYVCAVTGRRRLVLGLTERLSLLQALALELLPGEPLMSRDNVLSMRVPNVSRAPFPFGIAPQALEAVAPFYLATPAGLAPRERYPRLRWRAGR